MKNKLKTIQSAMDVWSLYLPEHREEMPRYVELLSLNEQARAERFIRKEQSERFILCRGLLRKILADYLDLSASGLCFSHNENGKPFLDDQELQFNLSHSRDRLLIAVTAGRAVGVDIEFRRDNIPMNAIAERWFSPEEQCFLQQQGSSQTTFFDIWAKKEATVKARGIGIFHSLNSFSVPLNGSSKIPATGSDPEWFVQMLDIDPAYAAAVVYETPPVTIQYRSFSPHG